MAMVASKTVPYKSGKIGGIHFSGQKKWRKKCVNGDDKFHDKYT